MDTLESLLAAIAPTGASRDILNPANGNLVAKVAVDTVDDLEKAIAAATKKEVDRRNITVPEIHRTGSYKVQVKLHPEVSAEINLEVTSH